MVNKSRTRTLLRAIKQLLAEFDVLDFSTFGGLDLVFYLAIALAIGITYLVLRLTRII